MKKVFILTIVSLSCHDRRHNLPNTFLLQNDRMVLEIDSKSHPFYILAASSFGHCRDVLTASRKRFLRRHKTQRKQRSKTLRIRIIFNTYNIPHAQSAAKQQLQRAVYVGREPSARTAATKRSKRRNPARNDPR